MRPPNLNVSEQIPDSNSDEAAFRSEPDYKWLLEPTHIYSLSTGRHSFYR